MQGRRAALALLGALAAAPTRARGCDQAQRELCCLGTAAAFSETMMGTCNAQDCQHTPASTCANAGSYTQCLRDAGCPTIADYEAVAAASLDAAAASEIIGEPCAAFPMAASCHHLIDWCCNGATVVLDGQAVHLTLVRDIKAVVEVHVPQECAELPGAAAADDTVSVSSGSLSVSAPTRNLTCEVELNLTTVQCRSDTGETTTVATTTTSPGGKLWTEVEVVLPYRDINASEPTVPPELGAAVNADVAAMFAEAGASAEDVPPVDFKNAVADIVLDVHAFMDYDEVEQAVVNAEDFYGHSFVHRLTTAPAVTTATTTVSTTADPTFDASPGGFSPTAVVCASVISSVVVVAAVVTVVVVLQRQQTSHRVIKSTTSVSSVEDKHPHLHRRSVGGGNGHRVNRQSRHDKEDDDQHRRVTAASQKVAHASSMDGDESEIVQAEAVSGPTQPPENLGSHKKQSVFHRRASSLSDVSPELAVPHAAPTPAVETLHLEDLDS